MYNEYPYFGVEQSLLGPAVDSGSAVAGIANRVSYAFDLRGPSMTVDTMCSASLVALHLATRALRAGECEVAVVAATNLSLHANKFRQIDRLGGASSDHLCRSFGRGGYGSWTVDYPDAEYHFTQGVRRLTRLDIGVATTGLFLG